MANMHDAVASYHWLALQIVVRDGLAISLFTSFLKGKML